MSTVAIHFIHVPSSIDAAVVARLAVEIWIDQVVPITDCEFE